jgi:hypothetical protein
MWHSDLWSCVNCFFSLPTSVFVRATLKFQNSQSICISSGFDPCFYITIFLFEMVYRFEIIFQFHLLFVSNLVLNLWIFIYCVLDKFLNWSFFLRFHSPSIFFLYDLILIIFFFTNFFNYFFFQDLILQN